MFKILLLIAVIYVVYRYQDLKKIGKDREDNSEEYIDYEEVE